MIQTTASKTLFTLVIGFAGAGLATWAGLPAGALLGSSLFVFLVSFFNITNTIPAGFRTVGFAIIGCSLGSGLTKNLVDQAMHWPLSLFLLSIAVIAIMALCGWILIRFFNQSAETAILCTSPGALAYTLSITAEGVGDARSIVIIQSIRVLGLIIVFPLILDQFSGNTFSSPGTAASESMELLRFGIIFLTTLCVGRFFEKCKLPAAYLLAGTVISGIAHLLGLVSGRPSDALLFVGFAITGTVVGSRFSRISIREMQRLLKVSLIILFVSSSISALFAQITSAILSLPFAQVFVAYAPGGIEAMAAMALSLGYDPAFVAGHHLYRLVLLFILIPSLLKLSRMRLQT